MEPTLKHLLETSIQQQTLTQQLAEGLQAATQMVVSLRPIFLRPPRPSLTGGASSAVSFPPWLPTRTLWRILKHLRTLHAVRDGTRTTGLAPSGPYLTERRAPLITPSNR